VEEGAVEVRDVDPQSSTLAALAKRLIVSREIDHLDAAAGAIHCLSQLLLG
jgi:hypothetical protein